MTGEPTHIESKVQNGVTCPSYINHHLKSKLSITFRCQLCSTHYKPVQLKNCSKSTFVIKVATMKNIDATSGMKGSHHMQPLLRCQQI